MNAEQTDKWDRSCGSWAWDVAKFEAKAGAVRAAVITAGAWEKTQSAQWVRETCDGARSSCK
jgi:hypothetical protein